MADYKPGDIANGHILIEGQGWVPLAVYEARQQAAQRESPPASPGASTPPTGQPVPAPSSNPVPKPASAKPAWYRRTWVIALAAGIVGLVFGAAAGSSETPDPTASSEYKDLQSQLKDSQADVDEATADASKAEAALGDLPAAQDELAADQAQLADDQAELKKDQAAVKKEDAALAKREKAVGIAEDVAAANTVGGDGMYKVGSEMKPGTYKTAGKSGCYFAVLNSADQFDIANNGNPNGPAFATVSEGQYFDSQRCADWILQR